MRLQPLDRNRRDKPDVRRKHRPLMEQLESRIAMTLGFTAATQINFTGFIGMNAVTGVVVDAAGDTIVSGTYAYDPLVIQGTTLPAAKVTSGTGITVAVNLFFAEFGPDNILKWAKSYSAQNLVYGNSYDATSAGLAIDSAGDLYAAGRFSTSLTFGSTTLTSDSTPSSYVVKLGTDGNPIWATQTTSGGVVTTDFSGATAVAVDPSGTLVAVGGEFTGAVAFGGAGTLTSSSMSRDGYLATLNGTTGAFTRVNPLTGSTAVRGIGLNDSGEVAATGSFFGTIDFGPQAGATGSGTLQGMSHGNSLDAYVVKLAADGKANWAATFGNSTASSGGSGVAIDSKGVVFDVGVIGATTDFGVGFGQLTGQSQITLPPPQSTSYALRVAPDGSLSWLRDLGTRNPSPGGTSLAIDPADNLFVGTSFAGVVHVGPATLTSVGATFDTVAVELDSSGNILSAVQGFSGYDDFATGIAVNASDQVRLIGTYAGLGIQLGTTYLDAPRSSNYLSVYVAQISPDVTPVKGDIDGDGKTDLVVLDRTTSTFAVRPTHDMPYAFPFGQGTQYGGNPEPIEGDFDGDGHANIGLFQPSTSTFYEILPGYSQLPGDNASVFQFGQGTNDGGNPVPLVGDFDGIGRDDVAVFQPTTSTFFLNTSPRRTIQFGQGTQFGGDPVPLVGDFDGDGKADVGVFQPMTSTFYWQLSSGGTRSRQFGQGTQYGGNPIPLVGDFEGTGEDEFAVFQPSTSTFFLATDTPSSVQFGQGLNNGGSPVPSVGDFNGDGQLDLGVFQPRTSTFYQRYSAAATAAIQFGRGTQYGGDPAPLPSATPASRRVVLTPLAAVSTQIPTGVLTLGHRHRKLRRSR